MTNARISPGFTNPELCETTTSRSRYNLSSVRLYLHLVMTSDSLQLGEKLSGSSKSLCVGRSPNVSGPFCECSKLSRKCDFLTHHKLRAWHGSLFSSSVSSCKRTKAYHSLSGDAILPSSSFAFKLQEFLICLLLHLGKQLSVFLRHILVVDQLFSNSARQPLGSQVYL